MKENMPNTVPIGIHMQMIAAMTMQNVWLRRAFMARPAKNGEDGDRPTNYYENRAKTDEKPAHDHRWWWRQALTRQAAKESCRKS